MPKMNQNNQKEKEENGFLQKMRNLRVNRAVFLSAIVILVALTVILVITAVTNRARRQAAQDVLNPTDQTDVTPADDKKPDEGKKESETEQPTDKTPEKPAPSVPTLSLPVNGMLLQAHSADLQVFSRTMQDYRVHLGIDLATAADEPVLAAADGTIARVWDDPMMGKCVAISHEADSLTVYKNLAMDLPEEIVAGASVIRGQRIGTVGDSAMMEVAEEPHLHMEMTVDGKQVNPLDYFPAAALSSIATDTSYEDTTEAK